MADVHHLPDLKDAEREASEWIARLNADDVSPGDRARFEAWRTSNPLHARVYGEISETWERFTAAGPWVRAVSFAQGMNEAAEFRPRRRWVHAAAAVAMVVAVATSLVASRIASETRFKTAVGEQATVSLPDGSTMQLNANSFARVIYSKHSRVIRLERGEAFFTVAHDVQRPFWVVGGGSWVRAVGTAFNVDERTTGVLVTVSEGVVKVGSTGPLLGAAPSDEMIARVPTAVLAAGQQADLEGGTTATRKLSSTELARSVAWRDGTLYFENRPLGEVVTELSRYTALQLVVEDERLRQLPVGGTFQANSQGAEALLTMLQQGVGLTVRREGDRAYIQGAPDRHP
jgi:transmembrane sensor